MHIHRTSIYVFTYCINICPPFYLLFFLSLQFLLCKIFYSFLISFISLLFPFAMLKTVKLILRLGLGIITVIALSTCGDPLSALVPFQLVLLLATISNVKLLRLPHASNEFLHLIAYYLWHRQEDRRKENRISLHFYCSHL